MLSTTLCNSGIINGSEMFYIWILFYVLKINLISEPEAKAETCFSEPARLPRRSKLQRIVLCSQTLIVILWFLDHLMNRNPLLISCQVQHLWHFQRGKMLPQRISCHRNQISGGKSPEQICPLAPFLQHQAKDLVWPGRLFHGEQFHLIYRIRNGMIEMTFLPNQW